MVYNWVKTFFIFYFFYFFKINCKEGHMNRSVDIRYSIVAFNKSLLRTKLRLGLPFKNV